MRTQIWQLLRHRPRSVAFREFIAAAPWLNPSSRQVPVSGDIRHGNDSLNMILTEQKFTRNKNSRRAGTRPICLFVGFISSSMLVVAPRTDTPKLTDTPVRGATSMLSRFNKPLLSDLTVSKATTTGEYDEPAAEEISMEALDTSRVPPDLSSVVMAGNSKEDSVRPPVIDDSSQPTPSSSDSTAFESYADGEFNRRLLAKAAMAAESKQENMRPPDNVDSQPMPFDSTNCGDEESKKIAAAPQPPTLNAIKKIDDGNGAALRPFNSSELEDESKPKIALGNESTNEEEGEGQHGNETVGATPFSRQSQKSEANAS
eukprot:scaffold10063_cov79-Skeletonema_marinoi.AAC.4